VQFNKRIGGKFSTCPSEPEIYWKKIEEEGEYADSHFSEIKRAFIDQIKQDPQGWKIKREDEVPYYSLKVYQRRDENYKDMIVTNYDKKYKLSYKIHGCEYTNGSKRHYKNGFTKEE